MVEPSGAHSNIVKILPPIVIEPFVLEERLNILRDSVRHFAETVDAV
jgi:4-aminobutyrate aminotransferase-like enzyme